MKVAAYQAPLLATGSLVALQLIRNCVARCEAEGIAILCCPEAILGGLADYAESPKRFALHADRLDAELAPIASDVVTTILGFTELADDDRIYNAAAVYRGGKVIGIYRKQYPAIHQSVYAAGTETPVFEVGGLTFGIAICNDSNYSKLVKRISAQGATALFVPCNNGLPASRNSSEIVASARKCDVDRAVENRMWVIRTDVAGCTTELVSHGSSGIVDPHGVIVRSARHLSEDLLLAEIGLNQESPQG